jgi:hypothetical protein
MSEEERKKENKETKTSEMAFFGKISLCLAIGGIVVPVALALLMAAVERLTDFDAPQLSWYLLHRASEIGALVTGIFGFRSGYGKAGLIISAILLIMITTL